MRQPTTARAGPRRRAPLSPPNETMSQPSRGAMRGSRHTGTKSKQEDRRSRACATRCARASMHVGRWGTWDMHMGAAAGCRARGGT
eukprot:4689780-Prymnesium_polylepis.1